MDIGGFLIVLFVVLVVLAYAFIGIGWLIHHELPYVILFFVVIVVAFLIYLYMGGSADERKKASGSSLTPAAARRVAAQAHQAEQRLSEARRALEREALALEQLQFKVRDDLNFDIYRQRHHQSFTIADRWYEHKREALKTKRTVSDCLQQVREKKHHLDQKREHSTRHTQRASIAGALQDTKEMIATLTTTLSSLNEEFQRGSLQVTAYNIQTARLREHICNNCGSKGRRWCEELRARKAKKAQDN